LQGRCVPAPARFFGLKEISFMQPKSTCSSLAFGPPTNLTIDGPLNAPLPSSPPRLRFGTRTPQATQCRVSRLRACKTQEVRYPASCSTLWSALLAGARFCFGGLTFHLLLLQLFPVAWRTRRLYRKRSSLARPIVRYADRPQLAE